MNIYKLFSGTFSNMNTNYRTLSWGVTSSVTIRADATDEFNLMIADFLSNDCGVDASYSQKGSNTAKWLWINGIPYLFFFSSGSNYPVFRGPYSAANFVNLNTITVTPNTSSTSYSFGLIFSGNSKGSFCLTFINYTKASAVSVCFIKGKNLITNNNVFAVSGSEYVNAWELNSDTGEPKDIDHNCSAVMSNSVGTQVSWFVNTLSADFINHPQKILLRKVTAGIFEFDDIYSYCRNCPYLPSATLTGSVQSLPVIEIKGEKFVVVYNSTIAFLLKVVE